MVEKTKVYINGRLVGFFDDPQKLVKALIQKRRQGKIDKQIGIAFQEKTNEIYINTDSGRVIRPLLVVENGKLRLGPEQLKQVENGELSWNDLIDKGYVEYLDPEEEENALIALNEDELTKDHTHMEIDHSATLSVITSMIPYVQHDMAGKALHGAKMFKQAQGLGSINYNLRTDTEAYLLYYAQAALVKTRTSDILKQDERPNVQNFVVAILPYYGFNILDALVLNKGAVDRGLARSAYFRTYESAENRYPGGQVDRFGIPDEDTVGRLEPEAYAHLDEDGFISVETAVTKKDVIIGKTSPPRFLEEVSEFGVVKEKRREASLMVRKGKEGTVDKVIITEGESGNRLVKVKIRSEMVPEVGDKVSSKHGQKGVIGGVIPEADMPFSPTGMVPDLLLNPHSIPSRMTVGHLIEMLAGKAASEKGKFIDGTPFDEVGLNTIHKMLKDREIRSDGREVYYDGITGERIRNEIFTGVVAYRRLFHMVAHKMQARSRGPVQILTRQPTEGKEKEGGLRFGEMEGETLLGHGAAMLLQEKFIEDSDKAVELVCEKCGVIAVNDQIRRKKYCPICESSKVYPVEMSYGFKLLLDELKALGVFPKLVITDKV